MLFEERHKNVNAWSIDPWKITVKLQDPLKWHATIDKWSLVVE